MDMLTKLSKDSQNLSTNALPAWHLIHDQEDEIMSCS